MEGTEYKNKINMIILKKVIFKDGLELGGEGVHGIAFFRVISTRRIFSFSARAHYTAGWK